MKKIIIIALLGLASFGANAQTYSIQNNERCDILVTAWCSNTTTCKQSSIVGPISVPYGTVGMITPAPCGGTGEVTFQICWNSMPPRCSPQPCVTFTTNCSPRCSPSVGCGSVVTLPSCMDCSYPNPNGTISYNAATNTIYAQ